MVSSSMNHESESSSHCSTTVEKVPLLGRNSAPSSGGSGVVIPLGVESKLNPESKYYSEALKLLWGVGGIYIAFIYYGSLQEDVFIHTSSAGDGTKFKQAWFLQVLEALANVIFGFFGRMLIGGTSGIPQKMFVISGVTQVCAKACTSLALANGLSFPVATLAKSGKMAPVMIGSLILGGAHYTPKEYIQVMAIIGGTALVSMDKPRHGGSSPSTPIGLLFISLSLLLDGITGGVQKRLKFEMALAKKVPLSYDFMYFTNCYMMITATIFAAILGEFTSGLNYIAINPDILYLIVKFSICSAIGQSFIFYTISHFDPLVCSTATTTRKIFSVLLSIFLKGHTLSVQGWSGIVLASSGIISEIIPKSVTSKRCTKSAHTA